MEQHLGRQSGVQKVQVSLIDGKVDITPKSDGLIDPIQLLKATHDSGVSVAEMSMIASGHIIRNANGQLVFEVKVNQSFLITQNDLSKQIENLAGGPTNITIRGSLFVKQKGQKQTLPKSLTLTIQEIQKKE